ncbi:MAG: DUF1902 domain-containing protein [Rhizobiaceae bacterium]|nr:DUF1902 domain-containing protein [Rhizobiaceae bacterium]
MHKRTFSVKAIWDDEASVFVAETDIIGLHIEAATIEEFEAVMMDVAPELIMANHVSAADLANCRPEDLVPAILWQRPEPTLATA